MQQSQSNSDCWDVKDHNFQPENKAFLPKKEDNLKEEIEGISKEEINQILDKIPEKTLKKYKNMPKIAIKTVLDNYINLSDQEMDVLIEELQKR